MHEFQMPEDLTAVEDIDALIEQATAIFDEASGAETITADDLAALRQLRINIAAMRAEATRRETEASEAAAEIDAMRAEVLGEGEGDGDEGAGEDGGEGDAPAEPADPEAPAGDDGGEGDGGEGAPSEEGELVTASAGARRLNVGAIRARQPVQALPAPADDAPRGVVITASADVPGLSTGQTIDLDALVEGVQRRAAGLKHSKRAASAVVASYEIPFDPSMVVEDPGSAPAGTRAVLAAGDQRRLPGGDLAASGGWCAPSETVYDIADVACPDMLWSAPEVQMRRGGLRFFQTPPLSVSEMTFVHTEADDIAGETKPIFRIPCPDPIEVRCDAIGVILEAGILTDRHFPELTSWYVRNSMVAHEIRVSTEMFSAAVATATQIEGVASFGAFSAVFGQVALQVADLIEKHSLCETTAVEVTFPFWLRNLFLADIARQNGRALSEIDPGIITRAFGTIGASVQFARTLPPAVPTSIGGEDPAPAWPEEVGFLIHPAGAFQIGRGASVDLGAVYDSGTFVTNDFTALFTEECVALIPRGPEARFVTVPICPDGMTGPQATDIECPIDAGEVVS